LKINGSLKIFEDKIGGAESASYLELYACTGAESVVCLFFKVDR